MACSRENFTFTYMVPTIYYLESLFCGVCHEVLYQQDGGNATLNHICEIPECIGRWHVNESTAGFKHRT